ncbi:hypothetical protein ONE63_001634 [Megalurothrips usitatus]|uniref:BEN domain-containing protein n=1 Tax=Megalurothrips usitatus TaxID=439358 RepID=A0AAV7XCR9_9NEOP|nr:hypothetical protein ONE63_001634 [Megalurothrips usitatus]
MLGNGVQEELDNVLKELGLKAKKAQQPPKGSASLLPSDVLGKRKSNPVVEFGQQAPSNQGNMAPKKRLTEGERRELAARRTKVGKAIKKTDEEILYNLNSSGKFWSDDSDDSDGNDKINSNKKAARERTELVKGIKQLSNAASTSSESHNRPVTHKLLSPTDTPLKLTEASCSADVPSGCRSPSKAELLKRLEEMEALVEKHKAKKDSPKIDENQPVVEFSDYSNEHSRDESFLINNDSLTFDSDSEERQDRGACQKDTIQKDGGKEQGGKEDGGKEDSEKETDGTENGGKGDDECDDFNLEDDDASLEHQLRGPGPNMVKLTKRTWCTKGALKTAHRGTLTVTQIVRRLVGGVFKPTELKNVTVSGYKYRPGSKSDANRPDVEPLHRAALKDVIGYAQALGRERKFKSVKTETLKTTVSHRLVEIKALVKDGKWKEI